MRVWCFFLLLHGITTLLYVFYANETVLDQSIEASDDWIQRLFSARSISSKIFEYSQILSLSTRFRYLKQSSPPCQQWAREQPKQVKKQCRRHPCNVHSLQDQVDDEELNSLITEYVQNHAVPECKMLAFSGLHLGPQSRCWANKTGGYRQLYAVQLKSMLHNAGDTLHPVVVVSSLYLNTTNDSDDDIQKYIRWLDRAGATVIHIQGLSFQKYIPNRVDMDHQVGPFIRLDIPQLIHQYDLFHVEPNICPDSVLYTDTDSLWVNPISFQDTWELRLRLELQPEKILSYGRQQSIAPSRHNTGVMVIDVQRFSKAWPDMLDFARFNLSEFPGHDQIWLNQYFRSSPELQEQVDVLPLYWNWKAYWRVEPSNWDAHLKVLHFHGPKPGRFLDETATCQVDIVFNKTLNPQYRALSKESVCCDGGRSMERARQLYETYVAYTAGACD